MIGSRVSLRNSGFSNKMEDDVTSKENLRFKNSSLCFSDGTGEGKGTQNLLSLDYRAVQSPFGMYL